MEFGSWLMVRKGDVGGGEVCDEVDILRITCWACDSWEILCSTYSGSSWKVLQVCGVLVSCSE